MRASSKTSPPTPRGVAASMLASRYGSVSAVLDALVEGASALLNVYRRSAEKAVSRFVPARGPLQRYLNAFALTASLPLALYAVYSVSTLFFALITAFIAICVLQSVAMLAGGVVLMGSLGLVGFGMAASSLYHHYDVGSYVYRVMESTVDTFLDVAPVRLGGDGEAEASTANTHGNHPHSHKSVDNKINEPEYTHAIPVHRLHGETDTVNYTSSQEYAQRQPQTTSSQNKIKTNSFDSDQKYNGDDDEGEKNPCSDQSQQDYYDEEEEDETKREKNDEHIHGKCSLLVNSVDEQSIQDDNGTVTGKRINTASWRNAMDEENQELDTLTKARLNPKSVPLVTTHASSVHAHTAATAMDSH